jgi:hypothetical protein
VRLRWSRRGERDQNDENAFRPHPQLVGIRYLIHSISCADSAGNRALLSAAIAYSRQTEVDLADHRWPPRVDSTRRGAAQQSSIADQFGLKLFVSACNVRIPSCFCSVLAFVSARRVCLWFTKLWLLFTTTERPLALLCLQSTSCVIVTTTLAWRLMLSLALA